MPEAVAGAAPYLADVSDLGGGGEALRVPCEVGAIDDLASRGVVRDLEDAVTDPPSHGVVAHSDERRGLTDPEMRHGSDDSSASAERQVVS